VYAISRELATVYHLIAGFEGQDIMSDNGRMSFIGCIRLDGVIFLTPATLMNPLDLCGQKHILVDCVEAIIVLAITFLATLWRYIFIVRIG
jgi:hypothetical protein